VGVGLVGPGLCGQNPLVEFTGASAAAGADSLLMETGEYLLLESGDQIDLE
jgi:hypothetical protein